MAVADLPSTVTLYDGNVQPFIAHVGPRVLIDKPHFVEYFPRGRQQDFKSKEGLVGFTVAGDADFHLSTSSIVNAKVPYSTKKHAAGHK